MLETLNIFSNVFGNPQIEEQKITKPKPKDMTPIFSIKKKTRKKVLYILIMVVLIYKEQKLNEVF